MAASAGFLVGRWSQGANGDGAREASCPGLSSCSGAPHGNAAVPRRPRASQEIDESRLAELCVREAKRALLPTSAGQGAEEPSPQNEERLRLVRSQLEDVVSLVEEKGLWSRGAGAKARFLLHQLPQRDGVALAERLDAAQRSGDLTVQAGAWIPEILGN